MPTEKTWQEWLERLYNRRRDKRGSHERPHKPMLLLSILDLLDNGQLKRNEVPLTDALVKTFHRHGNSAADSRPRCPLVPQGRL